MGIVIGYLGLIIAAAVLVLIIRRPRRAIMRASRPGPPSRPAAPLRHNATVLDYGAGLALAQAVSQHHHSAHHHQGAGVAYWALAAAEADRRRNPNQDDEGASGDTD